MVQVCHHSAQRDVCVRFIFNHNDTQRQMFLFLHSYIRVMLLYFIISPECLQRAGGCCCCCYCLFWCVCLLCRTKSCSSVDRLHSSCCCDVVFQCETNPVWLWAAGCFSDEVKTFTNTNIYFLFRNSLIRGLSCCHSHSLTSSFTFSPVVSAVIVHFLSPHKHQWCVVA